MYGSDGDIIRVYIASIKNLGAHPCPMCTIRMEDVPELGTVQDDVRREHVRIDSEAHQKRIEKAREGIFKKGWAVNSKKVAALSGAHSGVPVRVRLLGKYYLLESQSSCACRNSRMRSPPNCLGLDSIFIL